MGDAAAQSASAVHAGEDFFVGEWLLQPSLGTGTRAGSSCHLEPKAMQVLVRLAAQAGSVVSKDDLISAVWPGTFVSDDVLTHAIWQLRQAFGNDLIQTAPRRGYRLIAPVRPAAARIPALAVLPLANLSCDPEQEYFAYGMTETLISAVAQIGGLRVISRTSAMQYKASKKPLPQIAAELKVDTVVEGSVMHAGDRVRISVQLIRAADDQHLWAKTFDRDLRDVLCLQDEIARAIANEIRVTLTPEEHARMARSRPVNPPAHELYLKGRYCYFRTTQEGVRMAVDYMQQAIAADPDSALAHAALAESLLLLSSSAVSAMPPVEVIPIVRREVLRALELDPALPMAHQLLGRMKRIEWDWPAAEDALRRAISLDPSYSEGYGELGLFYAALNRGEEAIAAWQQACKLDPLSLFAQTLLAYVMGLAGKLAESAEHLQRIIRLEPNYYYPYEIMAGALSHLGRHEEAIAAAENAIRLCRDPGPRVYLSYIYGRAGRITEAQHIFRELQEFAKTQYVSPMMPAAILVALGEFDSALDYLEECQKVREQDIVFIRSFPAWRPLHGHPRFEALVRSMKFPD